jgi:hypothetical protein
MTEIQCFWTEDTGKVAQSLRRFSKYDPNNADGCPHGYHNALTPIGEAPACKSERGYITSPGVGEYAGDPRWPTHCACGYEFKPDDQWQVFVEQIYRATADGREWPMRELPPGAMYDSTWYREDTKSGGPDGINLCICLPPGGGLDYWFVDGAASNGPGWHRTGIVPNITATPSILTPRFHGWLRDGKLVSC